jgi:ubiquitin carboxyl-terminal hydrolase 25
MRKDSQTNCPASNAEKFDGSEEWTVAAYCLTCRYHFTITADYMHSKNACQLSDVSNPLHHLVLTQSENAEQYAARCSEEDRRDKFDQTAEFHRFMCSAKQCSLQVEIKISPPRLNPDILSSILDVPKVLARGRREIEDKPERYAGLSPVRPLQALGYLRTYIKDAKATSETSPENLRQIARRNKKYMLAFGDECDALFEYLDFTSVQDNSPESNVSVELHINVV